MGNLGDPLEDADATQRFLLSIAEQTEGNAQVSKSLEAAILCHNEAVIALATYRHAVRLLRLTIEKPHTIPNLTMSDSTPPRMHPAWSDQVPRPPIDDSAPLVP